jgi:hypothetical protein
MDMPDPSPGPEATLAQRQDLAALDDALNALPVAWRECVILREFEALSYKEMALQREVLCDDHKALVPESVCSRASCIHENAPLGSEGTTSKCAARRW